MTITLYPPTKREFQNCRPAISETDKEIFSDGRRVFFELQGSGILIRALQFVLRSLRPPSIYIVKFQFQYCETGISVWWDCSLYTLRLESHFTEIIWYWLWLQKCGVNDFDFWPGTALYNYIVWGLAGNLVECWELRDECLLSVSYIVIYVRKSTQKTCQHPLATPWQKKIVVTVHQVLLPRGMPTLPRVSGRF